MSEVGRPSANLFSSAATFRRCLPEKVSFLALNLVDLVLTVLAAHMGFHELNPLVRQLMAVPAMLYVVKLAVPLLIAWLAPGRFLLPAIALLSLVIGWNIKELLVLLL